MEMQKGLGYDGDTSCVTFSNEYDQRGTAMTGTVDEPGRDF
jgi:hypothetical protein